jgi:hypothetical protein
MILDNYSVTTSARSKPALLHIANFLMHSFAGVDKKNIDSVFGFSDPCKLYGGRIYSGYELTSVDLAYMYDFGIGYRIPLSNFLVNEEVYKESKPFLEKHHKKGNSVIVMKDNLAEWIKNDFPLYSVECSVTKEIDNIDKLNKVLELYDTVVPLPEAFNTNYELLKSINKKDRVRLFLNVGCSYHCPARVCYGSMSRINLGIEGAKFECSQENKKQYIPNGMTDFDIQKFIDLGFTKFKMLRPTQAEIPTGF